MVYFWTANAPQANTLAWDKIRSGVIGGSELSKVLGTDQFSDPWEIVRTKTGLVERKGRHINFVWGKLFEGILTKYIEHLFCTRICGDSINIASQIECHRNSPDGYFYIFTVDGMPIRLTPGSVPPANAKLKIIHLEMKNYIRKKPTGAVPVSYYYSQCLSGIDISVLIASDGKRIPVCDSGVYAYAIWRLAPIHVLCSSNAHSIVCQSENGNPVGYQIPAKSPALAWGFMALYSPIDKTIPWLSARACTEDSPQVQNGFLRPGEVDATDLNVTELTDIIATYTDGELEGTVPDTGVRMEFLEVGPHLHDYGPWHPRVYTKSYPDENMSNLDKIDYFAPAYSAEGSAPSGTWPSPDMSNLDLVRNAVDTARRSPPEDMRFVGVLGYKLFNRDFAPYERDPSFVDRIAPRLKQVMAIVDDIRQSAPEGSPDWFEIRKARLADYMKRVAFPRMSPTGGMVETEEEAMKCLSSKIAGEMRMQKMLDEICGCG